jgi:hypothetical protein
VRGFIIRFIGVVASALFIALSAINLLYTGDLNIVLPVENKITAALLIIGYSFILLLTGLSLRDMLFRRIRPLWVVLFFGLLALPFIIGIIRLKDSEYVLFTLWQMPVSASFYMYSNILISLYAIVAVFIDHYLGKDRNPSPFKKSVAFSASIILLFTFLAGYAFSTVAEFTFMGPGKPVAANYKGQPVSNAIPLKIYHFSPDTSYAVFLFSYTCPHCMNAVENLKKYKGAFVDEIIGLNVEDTAGRADFMRNFDPGFRIYDVALKDVYRISNRFPVTLICRNNRVEGAFIGFLPSCFTLK